MARDFVRGVLENAVNTVEKRPRTYPVVSVKPGLIDCAGDSTRRFSERKKIVPGNSKVQTGAVRKQAEHVQDRLTGDNSFAAWKKTVSG